MIVASEAYKFCEKVQLDSVVYNELGSAFEIVDGEQEGKVVKSFDGLDNATSAGHFRHKCEVIGLDLPEDAKLWQESFDAFIADSTRVDLYNLTMKTNLNNLFHPFPYLFSL